MIHPNEEKLGLIWMWCGRRRRSNSRNWYHSRSPKGIFLLSRVSKETASQLSSETTCTARWKRVAALICLQYVSRISIKSSFNPASVFRPAPAPTPTLSSLLCISLYSVSLAHRVLHRRAHSVPTVTSLPYSAPQNVCMSVWQTSRLKSATYLHLNEEDNA